MLSLRPRRRTRQLGAVTPGTLVLVLLVTACVVLVAKRVTRSGATTDMTHQVSRTANDTTAVSKRPTASEAMGAFRVRDSTGALIPLATPGEPAIIMVSSVTCSWCKRTLKDLGELSAGRPLPRLKLLTLEGATNGAPMLAKEKITGAQLIGPSGSSDQVLLTFRYPGTPTFVAVDREGFVVATMPGYPMREVLKSWFAVMVGDQDVP